MRIRALHGRAGAGAAQVTVEHIVERMVKVPMEQVESPNLSWSVLRSSYLEVTTVRSSWQNRKSAHGFVS